MAFKRKHARNSRHRRRSAGSAPIPAPAFSSASTIQTDGTPSVGEQLLGVDGVANYPIVSRRWLLGSTVLATVNAFTASEAGRYAFESLARAPDGREKVSRAEVDVASATVTPTPVPSARTLQLGANQDGISYFSADHFFVDRAKMMDRFGSFRRSDGARVHCDVTAGFEFDADGWVQNIPAAYRQIQINMLGHRLVEGQLNRYYIEWQNASGLSVGGTMESVTANSATLIPNQDGSGFFTIAFDNISAGFKFKLCREDQKALLQAGTLLNPESVAKWAPYTGMMRLMNWGPTNGSTLSSWADRPLPSHASYASGSGLLGQKGAPIEIMVAMANAAGKGMHYCFPALADDDFVRRALDYFVANLVGPLDLELSNEVWNSGGFQSYGQYQAVANALLGPNVMTGLEYHGYRSAIIAKKAIEIYTQAGRRFDLCNIMGRQYASPLGAEENDRYITWQGGKVTGPYGAVSGIELPATGAQRIKDLFDAYSVAPYSGGMLTLPPLGALTQGQKDFVLGCVRGGEAGFQRAFRQWEFGDQDLGFVGGPSAGRPANVGLDETLPGIFAQIAVWRQKADSEGVRLFGYEGNLIVQSFLSAWGSDTNEVAAWTVPLHSRPEMEDLMLKWVRGMAAAGMERLYVYKHVNYSSGGGDLSGFAGLLMWENQADTPRYKAVKTLGVTPAPVTLNVPALTLTADTYTATVGSKPRRRFQISGGRAPRFLRAKPGSTLPASRSVALQLEAGTYNVQGAGQSYVAQVIDVEGTITELTVTQDVKAAGEEFTPAGIALRAWLDPSDLSTLFQDDAGTVPVTAAGQPVRFISDKSGNNKHARAAGANSPTLSIANGVSKLTVPQGTAFTFVSEPDSTGLTSTFLGLSRTANGLVMWSKASAYWGVMDGTGQPTASGVGSVVDRTSTPIDYRRLQVQQRDRLMKRLTIGEPGIVESSELSLPSTGNLKLFGYGGFDASDGFYGAIITSKAVADANRFDLFAWLAAKVGRPL